MKIIRSISETRFGEQVEIVGTIRTDQNTEKLGDSSVDGVMECSYTA